MDRMRLAASAYGASRVAYGLGLTFAPRKVGRPWLGEGIDRGPTQVGARGLGARDAVFGAGIVAGVNGGPDPRPWLAACVAGDAADIFGTLLAADELPSKAKWGTVAAAGSFAAMAIALAVALGD